MPSNPCRPLVCTRWLLRVVLAAAVALLAAGAFAACGGSPRSALPAAASPPDLRAELLAAGDLPSGWTLESAGTSRGSDMSSCKDPAYRLAAGQLDKAVKAQAHASFARGENAIFGEGLVDFGSARAAQRAFATVNRYIGVCEETGSSGEKFTFGRASLGSTFGERSEAWRAEGTADGQSVGLVIALGQAGSQLFVVIYGSDGRPSMATVDHYVELAYEKVVDTAALDAGSGGRAQHASANTGSPGTGSSRTDGGPVGSSTIS